ncbi:S-layer homology domain-containing protein [Paenibacillus sp. FSL K6-3166]|uniref:S-layer homology domain-containing protein n=3 Tax=unclassified Paenibacillus TaxID=185978 RepID=UPI0030F9A340
MFKRSGNLLLAISLVFSIVSSLFMPGVTDAAPSNSNIIDQSSTSAGDLNSVAFGNGIFVAVGQGGISTSTNGVDWSISKKVGSPKLNSIVFANGLFLAIDGSEKAVYKSADGESWTKTTLSITPERLKAVNGKFFVWQSVYKNGTNPPSYDVTLLQSSDGVVWTDTRITSTNTIFGMQMLTDIAYGQNKYVVSANNAVYYTSTDLINWTTVTLTNLVIDHYNSNWPFVMNVMYLKDRFFSYIVTPFAKKVFTSTDGANWTVDASWDNKQFYGGASLNGSYLLYGQGVIYKSAAAPLDSTQWTSSDTHTTMMVNNMVYGNGKYVASGGSGLLVSSDLSAWSNVSGNLKSIAKDGDGNYIAVSSGEYGSIYKSNSSAVWNDVTSSKLPGMNAVTYGAGKFIAVTNKENYNLNAKVVTSTNGDTWTVTDSGVQDNLSGVAFGANQYVAVSDYGGIYSSVNGNAWTERFKNGDYAFNTVTYLNNQFVALGMNYNPSTYEPDNVVIAKSSDGVQWGTPLEIGFPNTSLKGIAYDGRAYILVGEDTLSQQAVILTTEDLVTFTKGTISADALNNISFGNGSFLAVGLKGELFSSADGSTWTQETSDLTSNLNGIIYDGNNFKVVGDHFTKMTLNLGPTLAYSLTATAATLTPVVGVDNAITLTVKNSLGDTDTMFTGTKEVTVAGYGAAPDGTYGSLGGAALTASPSKINVSFVEGVAQVNLKLNKAGAQAVLFSQAGVASPAATALNIISVAGSTATMKLTTGVSAPQTNGGSFAQQPVITLLDQFGNVNMSDNSTVVSVSKKDAGSWTLTGNMTQTAVAGIVTFTDLGATNAAGITGAQLAFDATNLAQITSVAVNLPQPQGAQSLTATAATLTPVVGVDNAITLTVKNSLGDTDTTFTGTKEVTVAGYGAAPDGTYGSLGGAALTASPSKINVSFVEGVAQVNLKLNKAGAQAVLFSQAGVASPAATALNIISVAGSTATMKLTTGVSAPQTNGGSFAQQPVITLLDQFGNVNTSDSSTVVSVSKKDAGSWTLTGNMTRTAVAGIVTFTDLGATNAAGITGAQLAFDATNLAQITSVAVNLPQPQGAQSLTATAATLTPVVGVDNAITLTVKNSLGDTDTTFTGTKEVTVAGYGAAPDGTYGSLGGAALAASPSKINVSFVEGVAQVNLKLNRAGAQAVVFSQAGVVSPAATALNIILVAGSTATMKLTTGVSAPPTNGGSFAQQPVITLLDQFGNVNTSDNSTVVSVSKKDAGSWTLTGNMTQTAVAGIVTFTDLGATNAAGITGAQLAFDATNLAQITSVAVNLPQPQGAQSLTATAATLTPVVGVDNAITLTVKNSLGDTDTTFTGTKEVTVADYGAAPDGTYGSFGGTALTASPSKINVSFVEGVAQVNLKLNRAGAQAVVFSQAGVASPAATALNIISVAGSTATMKLTTGVSAPQTNGGSFAQQPVITLLDQFGNVNTSDSSTVVTVSKKDAGSWTLTGNMTQTAVAGIVTFTDLGATNAAGITGAQLAFDAAGHAEITSAVIDLTWPELAAPSIETVTAGNGHIRITWSPVYGTDSYAVYQSTASGVYGAEVATISGSENSYDAVGLINGTAYYFIVKAVNPDGISPASNEVTRTPQVPAPGAPILHSPVASNGLIGLTWDPVKGAIGYTIYQGISSGIYETKVATVSESVYNYDVTGLTNGESYYFVVKASNPGGESAASNEVSTKPRTSPSAPTDLIAVAGDGEATVTFAVPDSNGGTPITNYEVTASPGNIVTVGATSPITVTGLANGTTYSFSVKAINSAGSSVASEVSNSVTPKSSTEVEITPTPQTPTSTTAPTVTATPTPSSNIVEVLVNGKVENAGTATVSEQNGQTITTIVVDQAKIEQRIDKEGQNAIITIPVTATSDVIIGELNGQIIKNMEQKQAQLIIRTPKGTYTLSAAQIDISAISEQFGTGIALKDMKVQISISVPTADVLKRIEMLSEKEGLTLVAQPLDFTVKVTYAGKTIEVTQFNTYVERTIPLADGVDLKKITTGLVFEAGGTFRHVPTQIVVIDGKGYAKIHSLTNSTYFIVQDPQSFKDVTTHWAKDIVNEMASRKVINGIGNELFNPSQEITRAEFAAIIVRGLGLKLERGTTTFTDVKISDWYNDAVQTAYSYKLIDGFEDGAFRPTDKITREQAMSMIAKAMIITDLKAKLPSIEASELLHSYTDAIEASGWAKSGIADTLQAGIITGRSGNVLAPKAFITRAEVAAIIQRLLQQSDLI